MVLRTSCDNTTRHVGTAYIVRLCHCVIRLASFRQREQIGGERDVCAFSKITRAHRRPAPGVTVACRLSDAVERSGRERSGGGSSSDPRRR